MKIKQYDDLYCLDKRGGIRVFKCEITQESDSFAIIETQTGTLNGKLIPKNTFIKTGKNIGRANETTIWQQGIFEAKSLWNSKLDEGYKSRIHICAKYNLIDNSELSINQIFRIAGIQYNTNKDWNELPMLAAKYRSRKKDILSRSVIFMQPKLNGVRCLAKKVGDNILLMSRGGQYYNVPHIAEALKPFFKVSPNTIFDGEIYVHGRPLQEISGAVRKEELNLLFTENDWLEYHIYDIINDDIQKERLKKLQDIFTPYKEGDTFIKLVTTCGLENANIFEKDFSYSIKSKHDEFVEQGYEGAIIRTWEGQYERGFRSNHLIKVKEFLDEEFEIIGCKISNSNSIEESFVFELRNNIDNQTFFARPTGTGKMKKKWFENISSYIGKKATVRFQERATGGLPMQVNLRSEKSNFLLMEHIRPKGE